MLDATEEAVYKMIEYESLGNSPWTAKQVLSRNRGFCTRRAQPVLRAIRNRYVGTCFRHSFAGTQDRGTPGTNTLATSTFMQTYANRFGFAAVEES